MGQCQSELNAGRLMPAAKRPITAASPTQAATAEPTRSATSQTEQGAELAEALKPVATTEPKAVSSSVRPQMLVYDGDCRFCVRRARWFRKKIPKVSQGNVSAVAWQDLNLGEVGLAEDAVAREAVWVDEDGKQFTGHAAIAKSLIHIGGLWGVAGRLLRVPPISWIARLVYRVVAANRHRLSRRMPSDSA